jgi:hypothetical protein
MIHSIKEFNKAFEHLSPEQAFVTCKALRANPPTTYNLEEAIDQLPPKQKNYITKENLATAQQTTADFKQKLDAAATGEEEKPRRGGPIAPTG